MGLILDTNFVITAEREAKGGTLARTDAFLAAHADEKIFITFTIAGELACGRSASAHREWERLTLEDKTKMVEAALYSYGCI